MTSTDAFVSLAAAVAGGPSTEMTHGLSISLALLLPAVGAVLVALTGRWPNIREAVTLTTAIFTAAVVCSLVEPVMSGSRPALLLAEIMPNIPLAFEVEPLGMLYALVASILWIVTSIYAVGYMRGHHEKNQTRFFTCFALAISAALGIAFAQNLFTLFLFYELLTFSTYPLVTHHGTDAARRAGRIYLGILVFTSVGLLLFGILWTWNIAGTLDFRPGGILAGKVEGPLVPVLLGLFAFGTGKAALMPFHRWLPNAMVAPTPVSALLHAVAVVKAGVFTVLKIVVYTFGLDFLSQTGASLWLMYVAAFTALAAAVIAIVQDNFKARLAYSTISHLAYIVLGAALATGSSAVGGGLHIAMHACAKITLFFVAGAVYVGAHKTRVSELNGLGRTMPFTMGAFVIGSLSLIGVPPFGGMWSKWFLASGAFDGSGGLDRSLFAFVYMLTSLLSIGYLMPVVVRAFFMKPSPSSRGHSDQGAHHAAPQDTHEAAAKDDQRGGPSHGAAPRAGFFSNLREAPLLCVVPLCLTAIGCVLLFFFVEPLFQLLEPLLNG